MVPRRLTQCWLDEGEMMARPITSRGAAFQFTVVAFMLTPSAAFAEVMDKEASITQIWAYAVVAGLTGAAAWRYFPRAIAAVIAGVVFAVGASFLLAVYSELTDPHVGPAIIVEAGPRYVMHFWAATAVFAVLHLIGFVWCGRRIAKQLAEGRT
jgi:hypothetical protein